MQISPSVRAVQVPDDNPMHPQSTNIYLVGRGQVLTVDSGEAMDRYRWMLRGYLAATEKAEVAFAAITHHHNDHSGNLKWARDIFGAEVVIPPNARPLLKGRLPAKGVRKVSDGEVFDLGGGARLQVLITPGHSVDSVCYYLEDEGVLFTGDTMLGSTTTTVSDLGAYRRTLEQLLALPNLKVICPGHGPLVHDPRDRLRSYITHRNMRERQILEALEQHGPMTSWDIMLKLYPDVDPRLRRAAEGNVRTHLRQLEQEGRITVHPGVAKRESARARQRREQREHEHARILKLAQKIDAARRREQLRLQENPAGEQWSQPPRFEIVGRARD
ncbi:MAG: MBL fold metallo-hydrolase [Dehalococcoidia bacterium]